MLASRRSIWQRGPMRRIRRHQFLAVAAVLICGACRGPVTEQPGKADNRVAAAPEPHKPLPAPEPKLGREELILAALRAATAAALGQDDSKAQADLRGRRFEVRIRFACGGPSEKKSGDGWTFDEKKHVLRVRTTADIDSDAIGPSDLLGRDYEGAVGFTLRRPLLLQSGCPTEEFAGAADGLPLTLVQLFTSADSRVRRPPSTFDMTLATEADEVPKDGLDLVLEGRLEPLADQRPIHCAATDGPPACIISAKIGRVAIEDPVRKAVIGEWSPG